MYREKVKNMKKLLIIVVLVLLMCNKSYAELQIFTISCEGTLKATADRGPELNETYYENLQIFVGNGKKITTINILPSHWWLRSDTYIPKKMNDPKNRLIKQVIIFVVIVLVTLLVCFLLRNFIMSVRDRMNSNPWLVKGSKNAKKSLS